MRVFDVHTHVFPDKVAGAALRAVGEEAGVTPSGDGTLTGLLGTMDRAGVDVSVLLPVATKPSQVRPINDWVASLASERIFPFGAMHPGLHDPAAEMDRMASLGMRGFKLHPQHQNLDLFSPSMTPVYEAARALGLAILFHAGVSLGAPFCPGTPEVFEGILDEWPGLTLVLGHMGGLDLWDEVERRLVGREVLFDTSYSLGRMPDAQFVRMVRDHGPDRVLFGSDGPWTDPAVELERLRRLLDDDELAAVLGGNAEKLFG